MPDTGLNATIDDGHLRIVLDVEDKPNPLDEGVIVALNNALDIAETDDSVTTVSFTGRGSTFSAGADLETIAEWVRSDDWGRFLHFLRDGQETMARIDALAVPTIAAINGHALGGGLELALACDLRVAARSATLGFPESTLGMIPGWGGTQRLPEVVGVSTAKNMVLTGDRVDAETAHSIGLVDKCVSDASLGAVVDEFVDKIRSKPPSTIAYLLDAVEASIPKPTTTDLSHEIVCDLLATIEPETEQRIDAFLDST